MGILERRLVNVEHSFSSSFFSKRFFLCENVYTMYYSILAASFYFDLKINTLKLLETLFLILLIHNLS